MKKMIVSLLFVFCSMHGLKIIHEPLFMVDLPAFTMSNVDPAFNLHIGKDKKRYSTCSSVSWLSNDELIASHLCGESILVYKVNDEKIDIIQTIENLSGNPELDAVSSDGKLYAVSMYNHIYEKDKNNLARVFLYSIEDHTLVQKKVINDCNKEYNCHGVRFSPDNNYLAYTTINRPGYISIYKKIKENDEFEFSYSLKNMFYPLKPKGIDFSPDGRFLGAVYSLRAGKEVEDIPSGIAIYKFNSKKGTIDFNPAYYSGSLDILIPENIAFYPSGSYIFISNQGNDSIVVYNFDSKSGKILDKECELSGIETLLSFPHGFSISPNGKYLAVANYGTNQITIYSIIN